MLLYELWSGRPLELFSAEDMHDDLQRVPYYVAEIIRGCTAADSQDRPRIGKVVQKLIALQGEL